MIITKPITCTYVAKLGRHSTGADREDVKLSLALQIISNNEVDLSHAKFEK